MPFEKLPTYSVRQLETRAGQYLADHLGQNVPIPVDIDLLVEREGIDLDEWPSAERVYGELVRQAGTDNAQAVKKWLRSLLAKEFEVSETAMHHRLGEWPMKIYQRVEQALHDGLTYLP